MSTLSPYILIISAFLILTPAGKSQAVSFSGGNSFYSADEFQAAHSLFDKTRNDLNQIPHTPHTVAAERALTALQHNWNRADYDSRQMANSILQLRAAINQAGLTNSERNILTADLSRLIEFQNEYY